MRSTPVRKLENEHLLNEFESLASWAYDDFAVNPITPNMARRLGAARQEILRRLNQQQQREAL
jgi:hypothetical protein